MVGGPSPTAEFNLLLDDYRLDSATSDLSLLDEFAQYLGLGSTDATSAATGFDAGVASLLATFTGGLDTSSAADLASTVDPAAAIDPSIFADALSSLGL